MTLDQKYYNLITRLDHPVFRKLFADVTTFDETTPFNAVFNLLVAKQMVKLDAAKEGLILDSHPDTVRVETIDRWEQTLFGFTKINVPFLQRRDELVQRFNENIGLAVRDVITLAESIVGQTPTIIRNLFFTGWILDDPVLSVLDKSTIMATEDQSAGMQIYIVIFNDPVDSALFRQFDNELTAIEKAGSRHKALAPIKFWVLDSSVTDLDTILG